MARRKDLTALAALGTLGYMLSKKGDKKDEKSTTAAAERRIAANKEASEEPKVIGDDSGMDPEEAANRRTERMLTNPNAREFGEAGTSMTVSPSKKPAASPAKPPSGAAKAAPKLIDPSNIRSGPRFDDEGLIDPSNIRSGRREFEESQITPASVDETKLSANERMKRSIARNLSGLRRGSTPTDYRPVNERFKKGGKVKKMASGGMTSKASSASKRADGIATKGKTRGKMY
jgi:hypothetical protein